MSHLNDSVVGIATAMVGALFLTTLAVGAASLNPTSQEQSTCFGSVEAASSANNGVGSLSLFRLGNEFDQGMTLVPQCNDCSATLHRNVDYTPNPRFPTELVGAYECVTATTHVMGCPICNVRVPVSATPLFTGLNTLGPALGRESVRDRQSLSEASLNREGAASPRATIVAVLESPVPRVPAPWVFKGNGGKGVKTWLSEAHVLEINPRWLSFAMFDSMDLSMTETSIGPGQSEPQEWRSTFTVGLSTDWQVARTMVLQAGYRFYNNPVPNEIASGAFPNATQHVVAVGMTLREGRHALSMIYGLDVMDPSSSSGISSARHGEDIDPLAHLVSLSYGFSF